jgi:hypothetical protein
VANESGGITVSGIDGRRSLPGRLEVRRLAPSARNRKSSRSTIGRAWFWFEGMSC